MRPTKSSNLSRRRLLCGDVAGKRVPIRPPWAVAEAQFASRCDRCSHCIDACEEGVIRIGPAGFPQMDFSARGCSFCGACVTACGDKALTGNPEHERPWDLVAGIADSCLAVQRVVCRSCGEICDERAIRFELRIGGAALPRLSIDRCTGCGACVGVCPVKAIAIEVAPETERSRVVVSDIVESAVRQEI